jgi:transposase
MSQEEVSRAPVLEELVRKHITQGQAAERLGVTVRPVKRLKKAYKRGGAQALLSKKRGQPSNHQLKPEIKSQALALLRQHYADWGPTLAHEKLTETHHLKIGLETVRQLMTRNGLWHPKRAKKLVVHPLRERRARFGELVQIDGSPYAWFEDRAPGVGALGLY